MQVIYREVTRKFSFILLFSYISVAVFGSLIGCCLALHSGEDLVLLVRDLPAVNASAPVLVLRAFLPLGVTYFAVRLNCRVILWVLVFIKSILLIFTACSLFLAYPQAGWLLLILVMASDFAAIGAYHWLWLRCLVFRKLSQPLDLWICAGCILIFLLIDLFITCPFTASLFTKI